jgi:hypothetical protein
MERISKVSLELDSRGIGIGYCVDPKGPKGINRICGANAAQGNLGSCRRRAWRGFQGGGPERPGKPVLRAWRGRSEDLPLGQTATTLARPAQWAGWSLPPGSLACEAATSPCRRQGTTAHPPLRCGCAVKSSPVPTGGKGEARKFSLPVFPAWRNCGSGI